MLDIGARIKARRKDIGLSAEDIAEKINVSPATIYRYESGDILSMRIDKLTPIADALLTTEAYLMGWTDDPDRKCVPTSQASLNKGEQLLLTYYRSLNETGKDRLMEQAELLASSPAFTAPDDADLVG